MTTEAPAPLPAAPAPPPPAAPAAAAPETITSVDQAFDAVGKQVIDAQRAAAAHKDDAPKDGTDADAPKGAVRGPDGKFAKTKTDSAAAAEAPEGASATDAAKGTAKTGKESTQAAPESALAPEHWPEAERADFEKLTPEAKALTLKLTKGAEANATRKTQEAADTKRAAEPFLAVAQPYAQFHAQAQVHAPTLVRNAFAFDHAVRVAAPADKAAHFIRLAAGYGVTLDQPRPKAATGEASGADDEFGDPFAAELKAARGEIAQLRQRLDVTDASHATQRANHDLSAVQSEIETFRAAKDANGASLHPHYDTLRVQIGGLMMAATAEGATLSLEDAYAQAVYANPTTRKALQDAEAKTRKTAEEADRRKRGKDASDAALANVSGGAPGEGVRVAKTIEEAVDMAAEKVRKSQRAAA